MRTFLWIFGSGLAMSAIALVGSITLLLHAETLERWIKPLVAFSAGSLLGGAFFHMLPAALVQEREAIHAFAMTLLGFVTFFGIEQLLHWHHCHRAHSDCKQPLTYLILIGDGLHNFMGGLGVGGAFLLDVRLGALAWLAAAVHEIPQELGDFGVLVHGGWRRNTALLLNFISGLTFLVGGLVAYSLSHVLEVGPLVSFAAGNFIYIAASDLVPEVNKHASIATSALHFFAFTSGIALLWALRVMVDA